MRLRCLPAIGFILAGIAPGVTLGQEVDPANPFFMAQGINRADLIVVGTFRVGWLYPWFDGWRYSGALHIETVLDGSRKAELPIEFRWKEGYGTSCLPCDRMSRINRQRGIWLLTQKDGHWRFSGTAATLCGWSLPMHVQGAIEKAIREKSSNVAQ
jgi:hypothetical protein